MSEKKKQTAAAPAPVAGLFEKQNILWMVIGGAVIAAGMLLMLGGKNAPNEFDTSKVYSTTRITIAPILILIGLGIEIYAIFKKPKD